LRTDVKENNLKIPPIKKQTLINFLLSVFMAAVVCFLSQGEFFQRIERVNSDLYFRLSGGPSVLHDPITIIEITNNDVSKIGRWPWRRTWHAAMAKVLKDLGARATYFDIIFSESSSEADDKLFAESMKISGDVYLPYVFADKPYDIKNVLMPIRIFSDVAKGTGAMNVYPDNDGTIRELPLVFPTPTGTYPHITLKVALDYMGYKIKKINPESVVITDGMEDVIIPLSANKSIIINWMGKWTESFKHYSFIDVLAAYQDKLEGKKNSLSVKDFDGAICLVGITGFGLFDIKPIPLEPEYPGVGIIANTIHTIINKRFIHRFPQWVSFVILCIMTILPGFVISGDKPFRETLIVILLGVLYFTCAFFVFHHGIMLQLFLPLLGLILGYMSVGTYNFVRTAIEKQNLFSISITDGLTGLCNIRYFKVLLDTEIKMVKGGITKNFAVILSDVDHFKKFNDTYGHQVGDLVLKEVAKVLKTSVRGSDIVARYGGEEMIILLKNSSLSDGMAVAEKVRKNLENHIVKDDKNTYKVTASFGVASYIPEDTMDTVIRRADEGLYKSKETGRNRVDNIQEPQPAQASNDQL